MPDTPADTPAAAPRRFADRTPIAVFPICLGLTGAGLALRAAGPAGVPGWAAELWLGMAGAVFAACLVLYGVKLARRGDALMEDLAPPPARGDAAAATMTLMLTGATLAPHTPTLAAAVWAAGAVLHWAAAGATLLVWLRAEGRARAVTPPLYLPFVGQIVAPIGGVALGYGALSQLLFVSALVIWAPLTVAILRGMRAGPPPPPAERPGVAILLAPPAAAVVAAAALGGTWAEVVTPPALVLALAMAALVIPRLPAALEGGWRPTWGAFTFPAASLAGAVATGVEVVLPGTTAGLVLAPAAAAVAARVAWGAVVATRAGGFFV